MSLINTFIRTNEALQSLKCYCLWQVDYFLLQNNNGNVFLTRGFATFYSLVFLCPKRKNVNAQYATVKTVVCSLKTLK